MTDCLTQTRYAQKQRRNGGRMEIFILEKIDMDRSDIMRKRIELLEGQLDKLRGCCEKLYEWHSFDQADLDSDSRGTWDEARDWMSKIQKNSWSEEKDTLSLYKAQACCYLGTVYKERGDYEEALKYLVGARERVEGLSAQSVIPECYVRTCAAQAKCYMEKHSHSDIIEECHKCAREAIEYISDEERSQIRKLELSLQETIFKMDTYGEDGDYNYEEEGQYILKSLQDIEDFMRQFFDGKIPDALDEKWKEKIEATLFTTKADYYKKIYFKLSDNDYYQSEDSLAGRKNMKYYFEAAFDLFASLVNGQKKNTIGLNSIAALLYDHYKKEKNEGYLSGLLNQYFGNGDVIVLKDTPDIDVKHVIQEILEKTLAIEYNNMFALNMMAALRENDRETDTMNQYRLLRSSALKHRFRKLKEIIKDVCPDRLRDIMINLIILHRKASEFMDSAMIDFNDPQWKKLKVGHYTRLEVLPKLINRDPDSRMYIQNIHHLNDPLEGVLFVDILEKKFAEEEDSQNSIITDLLTLYGSQRNGTVRSSVYMGSFTSRLDQLNMWSRYGDGGKGCSLQVDAANSFDKCAKISMDGLFSDESDYAYKMEDTKYPLYMVLYLPRKDTEKLGEIEKYARNRAATSKEERVWWEKQADMTAKLMGLMVHVTQIIKQIDVAFKEIKKRLDEDTCRRAESELCNIIMLILDLVRFLIKNDYYRDEREYRIIQYSSDPEYFCREDGTTRLYINVEKRLIYEKIYFGPLVQNFDSHAAYVLNIKKEKEEDEPKKTWGLEVCKSDIDYR